MISIATTLRIIAQEAEEDSEEKDTSLRYKYEPEKVTVFFSAPDHVTTQEVSDGGNFQWTRYELLFKRVGYDKGKLETVHHYIYKTPLYPWGERAPGGQEVVDADPRITEVDLLPQEAERVLPKYLKDLKLYPPGLVGIYVNTHKSAPGKKYPYAEFNRKFRKSGFYKVVTKSHDLENP